MNALSTRPFLLRRATRGATIAVALAALALAPPLAAKDKGKHRREAPRYSSHGDDSSSDHGRKSHRYRDDSSSGDRYHGRAHGRARYGYPDPGHGNGHGHARKHGHHQRRHFDVPRVIDRRHHGHYNDYYYGNVYDRGHRHAHAVYYFPVYTPHGYDYHPHSYCEGRLFAGGLDYRGPRLSVGLRF